jgi:hypothetical protein
MEAFGREFLECGFKDPFVLTSRIFRFGPPCTFSANLLFHRLSIRAASHLLQVR